MSQSQRDRILARRGQRRYESATVQFADGQETVWFCSPTGAERDAFEASVLVERTRTDANGKRRKVREVDNTNIRAKLVALTACEGEGNPARLFTPEDVAAIGEIDGAAVDAMFAVAQRLSGMSDDDVKELEKN